MAGQGYNMGRATSPKLTNNVTPHHYSILSQHNGLLHSAEHVSTLCKDALCNSLVERNHTIIDITDRGPVFDPNVPTRTVEQAAVILDCSPAHVRKLRAEGKLPQRRVFTQADLERCLELLEEK